MTSPPAFSVGHVRVSPPILLAPMEDVTSLPMRRIAKRIAGPGLMFSEFVSAMAIHYNARKTLKKLRVHPEERPLGIQIFGGEPEVMAEAARLAEEAGADIIDINMGCWVPKVCRTGSGAALLKDPERAALIVGSVVKAVRVPVTVKVRAGWDYSLFAAPDLARRFQDAGAQMITLHARFAKQGFEGGADWALIRALREAVTVPLVGNGDVRTPDDAREMFADTGCDGVMVGRAAISDPWALARIVASFTGDDAPWPTLGDRIDVALEHARGMVEYESVEGAEGAELRAIRSLRGQLPMYVKGAPGAAAVRGRLTACESYAELEDVLATFAGECAQGIG